MNDRTRARLAANGVGLFVAGLVVAIPFAIVFTRSDDRHTHLWSVAHLEAITHGLLLMAIGAIGQFITMSPFRERVAVSALVAGAWSSIAGATVGAVWDVLGVKPGQSVANSVAWVLLGFGTVAVAGSLVVMLFGAIRELRTEAVHASATVVHLPQFGDGVKHDAVVHTAEWRNWGCTQSANPVRIERPDSLLGLCDAVRSARRDGLRIKAVGGGYSWTAGAVTAGVMIDMTQLNRPIQFTAATLEAPATVTVEAGMTIHELTGYAAGHGATLATTTVIPWVQVGGALANGTHGTGRFVATFGDQICAMDVVGANGDVMSYRRDGSDTWRALVVNLGALGIVYSMTIECVPEYNVHAVDATMPMRDAVDRIDQLFTDNDCMEVFWFPFNEDAIVKTWNRTDRARSEELPGRAWDDLMQAFENNVLDEPLRMALDVDPGLTPALCRLMSEMMPKLDVVCPAAWAMQYQTSFAPVIDTSYIIPIDASFATVRAAWQAGVDLVEEWAGRGQYPQNMVLHARFVGRASDALLSPTEGNVLGSCLIEALTFERTPGRAEYFAALGERWQALGGRPHWAKLVYIPTDYQRMYGENLDRFRAVRARLDPDGVFFNDFLETILGPPSADRPGGPRGA